MIKHKIMVLWALLMFLAACQPVRPASMPLLSPTHSAQPPLQSPPPASTPQATLGLTQLPAQVLSAGFSLNEPATQSAIEEYLVQNIGIASFGGKVFCAYQPLAGPLEDQEGSQVQIYLWALCMEYYWNAQGLQKGTGSSLPVAIELIKVPGGYQFNSYKVPSDGSLFSQDVRAEFPSSTWNKIMPVSPEDTEEYNHRAQELEGETRAQAEMQFSTAPKDDLPETTPSLLDVFPLFPETSWTYTYIGYSQSPSDPEVILTGTLEIRETVSDVEKYASFTLVHILGNRSLVKADPGWQEFESIELGDYEFFYVLRDGSVYRSAVYPDPVNFQTDRLQLEFQFPMAVGSEWCPSKLDKGYLTPPAETPVPCAYTGKRIVEQERTYQTPAGSFAHCYQMRDIVNSGGVIQWFCDGVGVVAMKFDHAGSRFGFTQELTAFTLGSP